jgi:hypothetical protein
VKASCSATIASEPKMTHGLEKTPMANMERVKLRQWNT